MSLKTGETRLDYAVVSSPDGYANLRKNKNANSEIMQRLPNGTVLSIFNYDDPPIKNNWCWSNRLNGYVYVTQLKSISEFPQVPEYKKYGKTVELKNKDVHIRVKMTLFDASQHKITRNKEGSVTKIDGVDSEYWQYPPFEVDFIWIKFQDKPAFLLPKIAFLDVFDLTDQIDIQAYSDKENDGLYLVASIGDGAASRNVIWHIKNKQYVGSSVDFPL